MMRWRTNQQGFALIAVLAVLVVLTVLGTLLLRIVNKEVQLGALRRLGAESLYLAEAGGYAARAGLMVLVNEDPQNQVSLDPLVQTQLSNWYAGGVAAAQNPLALFNYLALDGQQYAFSTDATTPSLKFEVDWSLPAAHRKLQAMAPLAPGDPAPACPVDLSAAVGNPPDNALGQGVGQGVYRATLVVCKRLAPNPYDATQPQRYIQQLGADYYEFFYTYVIVSDGEVAPDSRRRVTLTGDFSLRVRPQSFAQYALFTNVHLTPSGGAIWFTSRTSFDGPVHTNGEFRFAFFPKFSEEVTSAGCTNTNCTNSDRDYAWFNNNGSNRRLQADENVVGGVRRDAPVKFDSTPGDITDDNDNDPAEFTRGVDRITLPDNSYNQRAIAIGQNPADTTPNGWCSPNTWWSCSGSSQWNQAVRQVVPELADNTSSVPSGIYIPVTDANANGRSDDDERLAGGIYVQGNLSSLTLSLGGATNNLAVYTLCRGGGPGPTCSGASQKVTVTVDRAAQTTTVTDSAWSSPQTRTFQGVPKGGQVSGSQNAAVIYVQGNIAGSAVTQGLSGTLEEKEQVMIAASGRIDIVGHMRYEDPPDVTDPSDNPLNVLGLFSAANDIRITTAAPNDLVLQAVLMAGAPGVNDGYNSSVNVQNYNSRAPSGSVHMIGGLIEEYYGAFGTFNPSTGQTISGFGRDFQFDRRLARGILPPYFPTTAQFEFVNGVDRIAGVRPVWREAAP